MEDLTKNNFNNLISAIKTKENFIPREYKSIGGMWTVETWQKDEFKVQLMDEGYTLVLLKMTGENKVDWRIMRNARDELVFENISEENFNAMFDTKKSKNVIRKKV